MIVGVVRFNFTLEQEGMTPEALAEAIIRHLSLIPKFDVAPNTVSVFYEISGKGPQNPPMLEFDKVKGEIRRREG